MSITDFCPHCGEILEKNFTCKTCELRATVVFVTGTTLVFILIAAVAAVCVMTTR